MSEPLLRKLMAWLLPLVTVLALLSTPAHAGGALLLAPERARVDVWPALRLLSDPSHRLTLADVQQRQQEFVAPQSPASNLGVRRDAVWLYLPVRVRGGDGRWVLNINYPPLQRIDLFLVSDGRLVQQQRLGSELPFAERPMPSRALSAKLQLPPDQQHELFLRVSTQTSMVLPITLSTHEEFHANESASQLVQGLINGIALALLAYSLVHGIALRSAVFGLYAVMLVGTSVFFLSFFGLGSQYLWHDPGPLVNRIAPLSVLVALSAGALFVARALETAQRLPRIDRGLKALAAASALGFLVSVLGLVDYHVTQVMPTLLGTVLMLLSTVAASLQARGGDRVAVYMLIGWGAYTLGALSMAALLRGLLPANALTLHLFQWSSLVEMLAWLRVLSLHVEAVRHDGERAKIERQALLVLAHTDALTGLPNRRGLAEALARAVPLCSATQVLAVFLLDLDGFKPINDRFGHDAGDELLVAVGKRLHDNVRNGDLVARLGGDEFVIMVAGLRGEPEAQLLGNKLLRAFDTPFEIAGQPCRIGLTIGFALAPHDGREAGDLLKRADAAMYAGKQAGRHTLRRGAASVGLVT